LTFYRHRFLVALMYAERRMEMQLEERESLPPDWVVLINGTVGARY